MAVSSPQEVTRLLLAWNAGEETALDKLIPLVYTELRRVAHRYMRRERLGHSLQTTALVNEAYLQLVDARSVQWRDRAHFFGLASNLCGANARCHAQSGKPAEHSSRYATR